MLLWLKKIAKKARRFDLSSDYAFVVGIASLSISLFVSILTFYKLLLNNATFFTAFLGGVGVFFIFTPIYSFIMFLGLQYFRKNEDEL